MNEEGIQTEIVDIGSKDIRGCIACKKCREIGKCVFDDLANELVLKLKECDGLVVGSPVYFSNANGSLLNLLTRMFYSCNYDLSFKVGASVVSRPYSIVSSPRQALENKLILGVENAGFFSGYLNDEAAVGTRFRMSEPSGEFHYETLRDTKKIVCLAGGAGITPFLSMAQSLIEGDEDYEMTLFYGARDTKHLAFKEELDKMTHKNLKVIYVLSDEEKEGYEKGFISAKLIEKYVNIKEVTFFLCGPQPMYDFLEKEFAPYSLPVKAFHRDGTCCPSLKLDEPKTFQLTIHIRDQKYVVEAKENETILVAMERGGIPAPNKCRAGGCGYCHSKWYKGEFSVAEGRDGRREADKKFGFIHPCVSYPLSDLEIEVPCEE